MGEKVGKELDSISTKKSLCIEVSAMLNGVKIK